MWKINIPVVSRGKRNYYKFADTVTATKIPIIDDPELWPSRRAFSACCVPDYFTKDVEPIETRLLRNLKMTSPSIWKYAQEISLLNHFFRISHIQGRRRRVVAIVCIFPILVIVLVKTLLQSLPGIPHPVLPQALSIHHH